MFPPDLTPRDRSLGHHSVETNKHRVPHNLTTGQTITLKSSLAGKFFKFRSNKWPMARKGLDNRSQPLGAGLFETSL